VDESGGGGVEDDGGKEANRGEVSAQEFREGFGVRAAELRTLAEIVRERAWSRKMEASAPQRVLGLQLAAFVRRSRRLLCKPL
jgi:hypothetical protein